MPWPVYTETFLYCTGNGVSSTWVVPQGKRAVITNLICCSPSAGGAGNFKVHGRLVCFFSIQAANSTVNTPMKVVAYGGESIALFTAGSDMHVQVSGYLFENAGGGTRPLPTAVELDLELNPLPA